MSNFSVVMHGGYNFSIPSEYIRADTVDMVALVQKGYIHVDYLISLGIMLILSFYLYDSFIHKALYRIGARSLENKVVITRILEIMYRVFDTMAISLCMVILWLRYNQTHELWLLNWAIVSLILACLSSAINIGYWLKDG